MRMHSHWDLVSICSHCQLQRTGDCFSIADKYRINAALNLKWSPRISNAFCESNLQAKINESVEISQI